VRLALAELSLDYNIVEIRLGEKQADVMRYSPTGTVPVMVDGDVVIWESAIMLDYLDAQYAPGRLLPRAPDQQAAVRSLHAYSDKCVGPALRDLVFEKRAKPESEWDREVIRNSEFKWRECQGYLESQLLATTFWGTGFGAADCALGARCGVAEAYGAPVSRDFPKLHHWFSGVKSRTSWEAAYPGFFLSWQQQAV